MTETTPPTVGRTVHYILSAQDVAYIDRTCPAQVQGESGYYEAVRNPVAEGQVYPAQVVATWGGPSANLVVQLDGTAQYWATSRGEGDQPGQWFWPPRV